MVRPNRQFTSRRHPSILPAGWVLALMMLETAPTPCSRTGFHISNSSLWAPIVLAVTPAVEQATPLVVAVLQVGSTISRSPGVAASIAAWIDAEAAIWVGTLPPIVTVTVSIDWIPVPPAVAGAVVISSWPHCAVEPPYEACCCTGQFGTPLGTATWIDVSLQPVPVRAAVTPPIVTVPAVAPKP